MVSHTSDFSRVTLSRTIRNGKVYIYLCTILYNCVICILKKSYNSFYFHSGNSLSSTKPGILL